MNTSIRLIVLACLGATALVFLFSNRQPLPLMLFGRSLPALPVAIWVLAFGAAGVLSGVLFQILPRLGRGARPTTSGKSARSGQRERPEIADDRASWESANTPDWGTPSPAAPPMADEWNIESPPASQTAVDPERLRRPRPERAKTRPAAPRPNDAGDDLLDDFDFPAEETTAESNDAGIVDAPYRVINPPSRTDDRTNNPQEDHDRDSEDR